MGVGVDGDVGDRVLVDQELALAEMLVEEREQFLAGLPPVDSVPSAR